MKGEWHISRDGVPRECKAAKNCPLGGGLNHFANQEDAQNYIDREFENAVSYNTETKLKSVVSNDSVLVNQHIEQKVNSKRSKIRHLETREFPKYYSSIIKKSQANRTNTPSKEEVYKEFYVKNNIEFKKQELKNFENEIKTLLSQRVQAAQFYHRFKSSIKGKSFSNVSSSSYFIVEKSKSEEIANYFSKEGHEINLRPMLAATKGDTFLLRISDHYPKEYYQKVRKNQKQNKSVDNIDVFSCTDVSMLVSYKDVKLDNKSAQFHIDKFYNDFRNDI
jgi:hypothetical protein